MQSNDKVKIKLQGHEKFALRDGWLNKGLIKVNNDPTVFQGNKGPDIFGIGNNMVKSLRYWLKAFGLAEEKSNKGVFLTEMGKVILAEDPYLQEYFTLWLLHSYISKNIDYATTWYMFFNKCDAEDLDKEQIIEVICREISSYTMGQSFSQNSVHNDVDVLLNMYGKSKNMVDPEDKSLSPLSQLNLIKNIEGRYYKNHPNRKIITEWSILCELAEKLDSEDSVSIDVFLNDDKGIIKTYQITTIFANELLDRLDTMGYIRVDRTAGLDMIYRIKNFNKISVIKEYYGRMKMNGNGKI